MNQTSEALHMAKFPSKTPENPKKNPNLDEMKHNLILKLVLASSSTALFLILLLIIFIHFKCTTVSNLQLDDTENKKHELENDESETKDLITFSSGEELTVFDIFDAPGEVIAKSNCGTLYKALLRRSNTARLLRFFRSACSLRGEEFDDVVRFLR